MTSDTGGRGYDITPEYKGEVVTQWNLPALVWLYGFRTLPENLEGFQSTVKLHINFIHSQAITCEPAILTGLTQGI